MSSHQLKTGTIYCGDCLATLPDIPDNSVDLIYIDPPFNSNRNYETFWEDTQQKRAFEDRFGDAQAYIDYMRPRVQQLHRVLKPKGSFYYHCDWHASHYIKVMLDQLFDFNNFQNEIVWYYKRWTNTSSNFQRMHDIVFWYSKSKEYLFNRQFQPFSDKTVHRKVSVDGSDLEEARDIDKGIVMHDVWDIPYLHSQSKERLGYPTQKPLELLERIITASSNKGDVVLDAFCGCGTSLVAAEKLHRKWIGIDISPTACRVMADRLWDVFKLKENKDFFIQDLPRTEKELRELPHFEFENWAVTALGGTTTKKTGDMGIDGRVYVSDRSKVKKEGTDLFGASDIWHPIQVKQSKGVGRPAIDNFSAAMRRDKRIKGYFVAFSYTSGAVKEVKRLEKVEGVEINLVTAAELLVYQ